MATQSCLEKGQKQQRGEVPSGPKNEVFPTPGNARETGNGDAGPSVPTVSGDRSPSGGDAPCGGTAGASSCVRADAGAVSSAAEEPGPPSMSCVGESGRPELQGGPSPHTQLSRVGPETGQGLHTAHAGSAAAARQARRGAVQASRRPAHTTGPASGRGRKPRSRKKSAQAQKVPRRCLFPDAPAPQRPVPLPPSSPRAQPSSRRRAPRASPWSLASQPGPDLRSHTTPPPGPALRSRATLRGPAACRFCAPPQGPAVRRCASAPGAASRPRSAAASAPGAASRPRSAAASAPGPAPSCRRAPAPPRRAVPNHASGSGTALRRRGSAPGPARRRRSASTSGPARRRCRRASRPGGGLGCSATAPSPASRSRASGLGPALRSRASGANPALPRSGTTAGFVPRSRPTQRRSTASSRPSLPAPAGQRPPSPGLPLRRLVFQSSSGSPDPEAPSLPSQPRWRAVRMRASSPSPPGRLYPFPGWFAESSSSSSSSSSSCPSPSPPLPPSSSSPNFGGLASISTPSPDSLRRALLLEFDALSPASPGEQNEMESFPYPPTGPEP
ncbi:EZH inhibitory protein [Pteronotus mesoamericanus]|uniref:EZH inhibitory protein n=1 Tax=Pteronotus mesoamericanus TaxID=1884717 RepID=UPI0023EDDF19|nr:EZH inhibitory protein [Pteronotus parnellii mesoamericanus]